MEKQAERSKPNEKPLNSGQEQENVHKVSQSGPTWSPQGRVHEGQRVLTSRKTKASIHLFFLLPFFI